MEIKLTSAALEDRDDLPEEEWKEVKRKIKEAADSLDHKDIKIIPNPFLRHAVWQLTIEETKANYRVYMDVKDGKVVVMAVWSFEFTHNGDQHWR